MTTTLGYNTEAGILVTGRLRQKGRMVHIIAVDTGVTLCGHAISDGMLFSPLDRPFCTTCQRIADRIGW